MNREQKRKYTKKLKDKGFSQEHMDMFVRSKQISEKQGFQFLEEGALVQLDVEALKEHPDYNRLTEKYKKWVEEHKDDVFTVAYDDNYQMGTRTTVYLEKDGVKSVFKFWVGDLKVVKEDINVT